MAHISRSLTNFLNDDVRVTFFGVDINENASKLHREYGIIKCGGTSSNSNNNNKVDICALAKSYFPFSHNSISSLKGIAYKVAGLSMRKRGNNKSAAWTRSSSAKNKGGDLVEEQAVLSPILIFAAIDACVLWLDSFGVLVLHSGLEGLMPHNVGVSCGSSFVS
ncbi:hypothetical protein LguiB_030378 [Lonicera macranthoides]